VDLAVKEKANQSGVLWEQQFDEGG